MPLYDFHCPNCRRTTELLVRHDARPGCPACGRAGLERLPARPAAPGRSAALVQAARARAKAEGHFSNS